MLPPFAAKDTWRRCLTSNGHARVFCSECFRKPLVQSLVRRLHSQACLQRKAKLHTKFIPNCCAVRNKEIHWLIHPRSPRVFLPLPIPPFPFPSLHNMACSVPRPLLCIQEGKSWCVPSPAFANERSFDAMLTAFSYLS